MFRFAGIVTYVIRECAQVRMYVYVCKPNFMNNSHLSTGVNEHFNVGSHGIGNKNYINMYKSMYM